MILMELSVSPVLRTLLICTEGGRERSTSNNSQTHTYKHTHAHRHIDRQTHSGQEHIYKSTDTSACIYTHTSAPHKSMYTIKIRQSNTRMHTRTHTHTQVHKQIHITFLYEQTIQIVVEAYTQREKKQSVLLRLAVTQSGIARMPVH